MCPTDYENDELIFMDEEDTSHEELEPVTGSWQVLVVDDDSEIHSVTKLALSDLVLNGKKLSFHHAYSGAQALEFLREHGEDIAIILLDVVMESDDAGLQVAKKMREELKLEEPRIILRTGQPGYAPEESVIKEYDINDYKTKTELTRSKLVTTIIASLRSYQQILTINENRKGLQKVINSSSTLLEEHSIKGFCEGVINQISQLINEDVQGFVCSRAGAILDVDNNDVYILGAVGRYQNFIHSQLKLIEEPGAISLAQECLKQRQHIFQTNDTAFFMDSSGYEAAIYITAGENISDVQRQLLEVFFSSVSVGYENVNLFHQLRNAAFRDWLTKLPNRTEFINMLDRLRSDGMDLDTVALVDISHFSDINDGLGQEAGNLLLIAVAERLTSEFAGGAKLARIGADVYGIIGTEELVTVENINRIFSAPFKAGDHNLPINVSIGICRLLEHASGLNVLKQTNIALNRAKKSLTCNYEFYAPEMEEKTTWRLEMIRKLRNDFGERRLQVWYQPQVDLMSEKVVGMEALLRWPTSDGGFISPAVFVPLAEYSGLIIDIGEWVLEEACGKLRSLNGIGFEDIRLSVNISMPQFRDPNFLNCIKNVIEKENISAGNLELEITESVVMDEPQIVVEALRALKSSGVQVAIDDFGTGFSSMSYLQQLPLDRLKVDRAFVNEVEPGKPAFIAETIITLGQKLGLKTIAEGVEKREQASYMLKIGCDEAQGYLYAKPMPYDQLVEFLTQYKPSVTH
ncbi:EAL domain-containing protein [Paraneptunicella aestuarii]|uniref:bifunctional diguanylate cyclase/phosphodiesterase n=1 Tax=Paraneptunicella aestuarii TaxID=2831148 RepID=UPI001E54A5B0|nr:EAL domain-containing protein [Paraneptunicella aestuarii]UAA39353.1 EAL domain-containing protein [Paraneptunicella aestuarii]